MAIFCGSASIVNQRGGVRTAEPLKCRRWSCPECYALRKAEVIQDAIDGSPERFITLTCKPSLHASPEAAARAMLEAHAELVRLARKRWGRWAYEYFGVWEKHKSGWPHIHVLQRGRFIPFEWLQTTWKRLTGAHRVEIQACKTSRDTARYVAKYLGKDPETFGTQHRYIRSQKWCAPRAERREERGIGVGTWWVDFRERPEIAASWAMEGWFTVWRGEVVHAMRPSALPP